MIFSRTDDPILVAAPTELVARPAMMRGAARPPVVRVRIPPAMVRLPPTTFAPVPTVRVILHLCEGERVEGMTERSAEPSRNTRSLPIRTSTSAFPNQELGLEKEQDLGCVNPAY